MVIIGQILAFAMVIAFLAGLALSCSAKNAPHKDGTANGRIGLVLLEIVPIAFIGQFINLYWLNRELFDTLFGSDEFVVGAAILVAASLVLISWAKKQVPHKH